MSPNPAGGTPGEPQQLLQIVNAQSPNEILASQPLADTTSVRIDGNGFDVNLTIDASVSA